MWLTSLPLWASGFLIIVVPTVLAMAGTCWIRRRVTLARLRMNNEVAGFKFATVGVLYAVLLAFAVLVVWEKFSDAESEVAREAGSLVNIYRIVEGMSPAPRAELRALLTRYLETAIEEDWPAMSRGRPSPAVTRALNALYYAVDGYAPSDQREATLMAATLTQLSAVTEARRERLVKASGAVPGVIWLVLIVGGVLTVGFTFFFGAENLRAQTLMTGALSVLIFSGLLVIVCIDHPFTGPFRVGPEPMLLALEDFGRGPGLAR